MILVWSRVLPGLQLTWVGPNVINTSVTTMAEVEAKIAVISGPRGERGERGVAGDGSETFVYSPPSAQAIWTIVHNLSKYPNITVVDSNGETINASITYISNDIVQVEAVYPIMGSAYLN